MFPYSWGLSDIAAGTRLGVRPAPRGAGRVKKTPKSRIFSFNLVQKRGHLQIAVRNSFFLPVKALSKFIRAKFVEALVQAFHEERLKGRVQGLEGTVQFHRADFIKHFG